MKQGKGANRTAVRFLAGALIVAFNTNISSFIIIIAEKLREYTQTCGEPLLYSSRDKEMVLSPCITLTSCFKEIEGQSLQYDF